MEYGYEVTSNCFNFDADGTEVKITFSGSCSYIWVENLGSADILVSREPDIANQGFGAITRPPNSSFGMQVSNSTIYISGGNGTVNVIATSSAENPFKIAGKGGGGNSTSVSKTMGYITDGLKCHYSADGDHFTEGWRIDDLSGNGNAGIFFILNGSTSVIPKYLYGTKNSINLNSYFIIMPEMNYSPVTLEIMCNIGYIPLKEVDFISNLDSGGYAIYYHVGNKKICAILNINGTYYTTPGAPIDSLIHLFSVTYDNQTIRFYVDGILIDTMNASGNIKYPGDKTVMGINVNPHEGAADGTLGIGGFDFYSARIYDRALTSEEIMHNFSVDNALFIN